MGAGFGLGCGLGGASLVTSDAHAGLVGAIVAHLPGATWQRFRTHYAANLMTATLTPMLHSGYDQPDVTTVTV